MNGDRAGVRGVEICFVRHGETQWNLEGRVQGQQESALSARGVLQSQAVSRRLRHMGTWQAVYSSDLVRAQQTASAIASALGLSVRTRLELRERAQGKLEGALITDIQTSDIDSPNIGREDPEAFAVRCWQGMHIVSARGGRAIVVTHGGVIRFLRQHLGPADTKAAAVPRNASISILSGEPPHFSWSIFDDISHLTDGVLDSVSHDVIDALVGVDGDVNPSGKFV